MYNHLLCGALASVVKFLLLERSGSPTPRACIFSGLKEDFLLAVGKLTSIRCVISQCVFLNQFPFLLHVNSEPLLFEELL